MSEELSQAEPTAPKRRPRAWWQWALGICLIGAACLSLGFRVFLHFRPEFAMLQGFVADPIPLKLPDGMKEAPSLPAKPGEFEGCNVLLVTLDTTRADRLGCYGNRKIKTPTLDGLATSGVLFSKAAATGPTTLPSHATILTGLYPHHHGARANGVFRLKEDKQTLAKVLSAQGYATGAAVSAFVLDSRYGLAQGFDEYDDKLTSTSEQRVHGDPERFADKSTDIAISWIKRHQDKPFFYWLHYFDPHQPYEPPGKFGEDYADFPYDGEIAFVDTELSRLLGVLDEAGIREKTIVVVVGDHGQGLGQHGELTHGFLVHESTISVPFLMACGSRLGGGVHVPGLVSLVDVYPTLLSLLGFPQSDGIDGIDLTQEISESRVVYMETLEGLNQLGSAPLLAIREGDLKYIHGPKPELFDLSVDPYELDNLYTKRPEEAKRIYAMLESHHGGDLVAAAYAQPSEQLTEDDMRMLRALGYVSIGITAPSSGAELPDPKDLLPLFHEAESAYNRRPGEPAENAVRRLRAILDRHPDFYLGLRYLASTYFELEDYENAKIYFNRCIELHPDVPFPLVSMARVAVRERDIEAAIHHYEETIQRCPDYFPALTELGTLYLKHNQPRKASHLLLKACTIRPTDQQVIERLGEAMQRADRVDEAVAFLKDRLEKNPRLFRVRNVLSALLIDRDDCQGSLALMREGAELHPDNPDVLAIHAFVLTWCSAGQPTTTINQAIAIMEDLCQQTNYENPYYLRTLSMAYAELLRVDEAIAMATKARQIAMDRGQTDLVDMLDTFLLEFEEARQKGITPMTLRGGTLPTAE